MTYQIFAQGYSWVQYHEEYIQNLSRKYKSALCDEYQSHQRNQARHHERNIFCHGTPE